MKRYWPVFLALFCWFVVLVLPLTRYSLAVSWNIMRHRGLPPNPALVNMLPDDGMALRGRFPKDKRIPIYIASQSQSNVELKLDNLRKRYPRDPLFVAMRLQARMNNEVVERAGAISNPGSFAPPRTASPPEVDWTDFIALARYGQRLEPNNSYFDWVLLFGLYAANRDEEAGPVLRAASQKTAFDSHSRELTLNNFEVLKMIGGEPVPPMDLVRISVPFFSYDQMYHIANWTMDVAVADRKAGNHERALNNSLYLVKMARLMRREGYDIAALDTGYGCEIIGLTNSQARLAPGNTSSNGPGNTSTDSTVSGPHMLKNYANEQGRADVAQFASSEWAELANWQKAGAFRYAWLINTVTSSFIVNFVNELRNTILISLPVTLVLWIIFGALSWRYRGGPAVESKWRRGAVIGAIILVVQWVMPVFFSKIQVLTVNPHPLFSVTPNWVVYGIPLALLCTGLHQANKWQSNRQNAPLTAKARLKMLFAPTDNGLPRFDFGWFFGVALRMTYWVALPALFATFYASFISRAGIPLDTNMVSAILLALAAGLSLGAFLVVWLHRPRRGETLRLGFRFVYQMASGYLVTASMLYAVVAIASLLIGLNYQAEWQRKFEMGQVKVARAELGLK